MRSRLYALFFLALTVSLCFIFLFPTAQRWQSVNVTLNFLGEDRGQV